MAILKGHPLASYEPAFRQALHAAWNNIAPGDHAEMSVRDCANALVDHVPTFGDLSNEQRAAWEYLAASRPDLARLLAEETVS